MEGNIRGGPTPPVHAFLGEELQGTEPVDSVSIYIYVYIYIYMYVCIYIYIYIYIIAFLG